MTPSIGADRGPVALRQRLDDRDLVDHHQPIGAGDVDAHAEGRADRHQHAEQHERHDDRQHREDRPHLAAHQVAPDERQELHAVTASSTSSPFSRCSVRFARVGGVRVVRHHDDGLAVLAVERLQQVEDLVARLAIEVAGRLVAQQQRRVGDDGARDADALLLAARELARVVIGPLAEPDDRQRRLHPLLALGRRRASSAAAAARRSAPR